MEENKKLFEYDRKLNILIDGKIARMELASLRKARHLSQKEVSERSGLSTQCISDLENDGNPRLDTLIKYINAIDGTITFMASELAKEEEEQD